MSQRTEQVASELAQIIGEIFSRELEFPDGTLATITRVEVMPDLKYADVYISVLPFAESERVMGYLIRQRGQVQKAIGRHLVMRNTPKIMFRLDTLPEHAAQLEAIMDKEAASAEENES